jgi:hypothetical protein
MGTNVSRVPAASVFKVKLFPIDEGSEFIRSVDTNLSKCTILTPQNIELLILHTVLYTSDTWALRCIYEHRFKESEYLELREREREREEVRGDERGLHTDERSNLYTSSTVLIRITKSKAMRLGGVFSMYDRLYGLVVKSSWLQI